MRERMSKEQIGYSIKQLEEMLRIEKDPHANVGGYGAHLSHWYGTARPIQIDERAIACLIKHYKRRKGAIE